MGKDGPNTGGATRAKRYAESIGEGIRQNTETPGFLESLYFVGAPRFELGTSRTRTVRSTGLSHAPIDYLEKQAGLYTPDMFYASFGFATKQ